MQERGMEMHQIRYFLAVARSLNFTRAAEQCNVAQPSLTKAIQKLEEELGGLLLHRERQNTHLTELGRLMLPHLERTYVAAQTAKDLARGVSKGEMAHLRIGTLETVSAELLVGLFDGLKSCLNGFDLTLVRLPHKELVARALEGDFDLVFLSDAVELPEKMRSWVLFRESCHLVMRPDHALARQETVALEDLAETEMIERLDCADYERFKFVCVSTDVKVRFRHHVQGTDELQRLVRAGFGMGILPASVPLLDGVVARPFADNAPTRGVTIAVVAGRPFMTATEACLRLARTRAWDNGAVRIAAI
jgi:DNA-binding transcriptional LysR family regulator